MMYVSLAGDLNTSGFEMTKRMFFDFLMVTRTMPVIGFMPSFCIAFLLAGGERLVNAGELSRVRLFQ
jgi:hypothetical protein